MTTNENMSTRDMTERIADISLRKAAIIAGIGYLMSFVGAIFASSAATANNMSGAEVLFRAGVIGYIVAILGDMLELGANEAAMHRDMAKNAHLKHLDLIHCAGPLMRNLWDALPDAQRGQWAETAAELVPRVSRLVDAGDVVLVKGSKGSKVSLIVDAIRKLGHRLPQQE